jgi:hypothetical protein
MTEAENGLGFCARKRAARQEMKEAFRNLLPEAFWEHAKASRREAKLACAAFRRAAKRQFCDTCANKPLKEEIEIN